MEREQKKRWTRLGRPYGDNDRCQRPRGSHLRVNIITK